MSPRRPQQPDDPLWQSVTRDVKPLRGGAVRPASRALPKPAPLPTSEPKPKRAPPGPDLKPPKPAVVLRAARLRGIEPRLLRSIKRGQTRIEHRLDLHGRTQAEAHRQLERTLAAMRLRGQKLALVITGTGTRRGLEQGSGEPGVLRRSLALWLAEPPLAEWVLGLSPAASEHGGAGAFYLLLRRAR